VSGKRFFLNKVNNGEDNVAFIFATDKRIKILDDSEKWFADSTFKTAPSMFL
jgi:hypothetical protein